MKKRLQFQSTQPEWAATAKTICPICIFGISIHAARVGCDLPSQPVSKCYRLFQSTQPEWAATDCPCQMLAYCFISIHAARVGCDGRPCAHAAITGRYFNPRSPSGLRRCNRNTVQYALYFNPRSPSGLRHNGYLHHWAADRDFNPRSPSGLRPLLADTTQAALVNFNPRSPSGLRLFTFSAIPCIVSYFNPRSPSGLRLCSVPVCSSAQTISIHAARVGCDMEPL